LEKKSGLQKGIRQKNKPTQSVEEALRELKSGAAKKPGYRERALALYGHMCARCGKEFDASNLHLLTVHHKDGNAHNNPPDGSNWENLCAYCHEAEHSRELLGEYENGGGRGAKKEVKDQGEALGTLADLFKNAKRK